MYASIKFLVTAAVYITSTSGGFSTALALPTTASASRAVETAVPNDSMTEYDSTMDFSAKHPHVPIFRHDEETEGSNKSTALVTAPSAQPNAHPSSSVTASNFVPFKTDNGVEVYSRIGRTSKDSYTAKSIQQLFHQHYHRSQQGNERWSSSVLAEYRNVFTGITERLIATTMAAIRCFGMVQDLGDQALAMAKHELMEFYHNTSSSAVLGGTGSVISTPTTVAMEVYGLVKGFALKHSSTLDGYQDAFTGIRERLPAVKNAMMGCFRTARGLIQKAFSVTKRETIEFYRTASGAMRRIGVIVATYSKPTVMEFYDWALDFGQNSSILVRYHDVFTAGWTEHIAAVVQNTTVQHFALLQQLGERAVSVTKRETIEFYKTASGAMRRIGVIVATYSKPTVMEFYDWALDFGQNSSILVRYHDVFTAGWTEHIAAVVQNTTVQHFALLQQLGERAVSVTKREVMGLYKISSSTMRRTGGIVSSYKSPTVMEISNWAQDFGQKHRSVFIGYEDVTTMASYHLAAFKNATMRYFELLRDLGNLASYEYLFVGPSNHIAAFSKAAIRFFKFLQGLGEKALTVTKREVMDFSKRFSSGMGRFRNIMSASGPSVLGMYNQVIVSRRDAGSGLVGDEDLFTETSEQVLASFVNAAMRCFRLGRDSVDKALAVAKHAVMEFNTMSSGAMDLLAFESVMGYYDWARGLVAKSEWFDATTFLVEQGNGEPIVWPSVVNQWRSLEDVGVELWETITQAANGERFWELACHSTCFLLLGAIGGIFIHTKLSQGYDATNPLAQDDAVGPFFQAHPF